MCSLISINLKTYRLQLKLSTTTGFFDKIFNYIQAQFWRDTLKKSKSRIKNRAARNFLW